VEAAAPPVLKNFRANSVFRASANWSKILNDKKIFQYGEIIQGNSVFQILNGKKYIQCSVKF